MDHRTMMSGNVLGLTFKNFHGPKCENDVKSSLSEQQVNSHFKRRKKDSFVIELAKLLDKDNNEDITDKVC